MKRKSIEGSKKSKNAFKERSSNRKSSYNADNFVSKIIINTLNFGKKESKEGDGLSLDILKKEYDNYTEGEVSSKPFNIVKSWAANTYCGLLKNYNEDMYSVCEHITKPANSKLKNWPKLSYFAIFDGHGGEECSKFFKNNFQNFLINNPSFPVDIKSSLQSSIDKCEEAFNEEYKNNKAEKPEEIYDKSGSCVNVILICDNTIYIANVGDSRSIISMENGTKFKTLSIDHKPNNPKEFERIIKNGGKVYIDNDDPIRDINKVKVIENEKEFDKYVDDKTVVSRIYPNDLAVARTVGDIINKKKILGGNPNLLINTADVTIIDSSPHNDFIIMGCDGIFDMLSNKDIIDCAWYTIQNMAKERKNDIHLISLDICNMIIKNSMVKLSGDNLTCIVIGLEGLEKYLHNKENKDKINKAIKERDELLKKKKE